MLYHIGVGPQIKCEAHRLAIDWPKERPDVSFESDRFVRFWHPRLNLLL
jgi:hypothetical protein